MMPPPKRIRHRTARRAQELRQDEIIVAPAWPCTRRALHHRPNGAGKSTLFNLISGARQHLRDILLHGRRSTPQALRDHAPRLAPASRSATCSPVVGVREPALRVLGAWATSTRSGSSADLDDANDLPKNQKCSTREAADVLAMNLTYAEHGAGDRITIAGVPADPLDEPTAGMSRSETSASSTSSAKSPGQDAADVSTHGVSSPATRSRCSCTASHRLRPAERCASTTRAGGLPRRGACRRQSAPLMRRHADTAQRPRLLRKSHVLHGVNFDVRRARSWRCWAATDRAARRPSNHHGPRRWHGSVAGRRRDPGPRPSRCAHRIGYVPRTATSSDADVHQNLLLARSAAQGAALSFDDMYALSRAGGAQAHRSRRAVGRRAADAHAVPHADGDPELIMIDEPTRAWRQDRRAGGRVPARTEAARHLGVLVEQKLTIALEVADRCLVMGHGRSSSKPAETCGPTPTSARNAGGLTADRAASCRGSDTERPTEA